MIAVVMAGGAQTVWAEDRLRLVGPVFPPYYDTDADGRLTGDIVDLFDLIAGEAGFAWDGYLAPARRGAHDLLTGTADVTIAVDNPILSGSGKMLRSRSPVAMLILNAYVRPEDLERFDGLDSLAGLAVSARRGYGYGGLRAWLDDPANRVRVHEFERADSGLRMVETGRADAVLLYDVNYREAVERYGYSGPLVAATVQHLPLYIHLSKAGVAAPQAVLARLEQAHARLVERGEVGAPTEEAGEVLHGGEPSRNQVTN